MGESRLSKPENPQVGGTFPATPPHPRAQPRPYRGWHTPPPRPSGDFLTVGLVIAIAKATFVAPFVGVLDSALAWLVALLALAIPCVVGVFCATAGLRSTSCSPTTAAGWSCCSPSATAWSSARWRGRSGGRRSRTPTELTRYARGRAELTCSPDLAGG
jgi:hypothetical protein